MRQNKGEIIILFLLIFLFFSNSGKAAEDEKQKLKSIEKELESSRQLLKETKVKEQETLGKLVVIKKELSKAQKNLQRAERKISLNEAQIGMLSQELRKTAGFLKEKESELSQRIKETYKSSGINHLEILFASQSMSDFLHRFFYLEKILAQDASLIEETQSKLQETHAQRETLKVKTEEIKELAEVIEEEKEKVKKKESEEKQVYTQLLRREEEFKKKIAELERSSLELQTLIQQKETERTRAGIAPRGSGTLGWPLKGRLTSRFGYRRHPYWGGRHLHTGMDIAAPFGSPIVAADAGEVILSGWWDGYGKAIAIDHGRGMSTVYAHMARLYLQVGAMVNKGQIIGLVGSTGYSSGPHLHFEVRRNGKPVDPLRYLP